MVGDAEEGVEDGVGEDVDEPVLVDPKTGPTETVELAPDAMLLEPKASPVVLEL